MSRFRKPNSKASKSKKSIFATDNIYVSESESKSKSIDSKTDSKSLSIDNDCNANIKPFRVMQFNILFNNTCEYVDGNRVMYIDLITRTRSICNMILETKANVVCFQEVTNESFQIIADMLSYRFKYRYPTNIENYDTLIVSETPFVDSSTKYYKNTEMNRSIRHVVTIKDDVRYIIGNTHIESKFTENAFEIKNKQYEYMLKYIDSIAKKIIYNSINDDTNENVMDTISIICSDTNISTNDIDIMFNQLLETYDFKDIYLVRNSQSKSGRKIKKHTYTYDPTKNKILKTRYNKYIRKKMRARFDRIVYKEYDTNIDLINNVNFKLIKEPVMSDHFPAYGEINISIQ